MRQLKQTLSASLLFVALLISGCTADGLAGAEGEDLAARSETSQGNACWGQASAVFAQTGEMGEHASQEETPRLGLYNLAQALAEAGVIPEGTIQALGAFVANELGLSIDACM